MCSTWPAPIFSDGATEIDVGDKTFEYACIIILRNATILRLHELKMIFSPPHTIFETIGAEHI